MRLLASRTKRISWCRVSPESTSRCPGRSCTTSSVGRTNRTVSLFTGTWLSRSTDSGMLADRTSDARTGAPAGGAKLEGAVGAVGGGGAADMVDSHAIPEFIGKTSGMGV